MAYGFLEYQSQHTAKQLHSATFAYHLKSVVGQDTFCAVSVFGVPL